jgi:chemotaxis protein MotA
MNFSLPLGLIIGVVVIIWSVMGEMKNPAIMGNLHGIVIVVGGTLAAALVCFPFKFFIHMFVVLIRAFSGSLKKECIHSVNVLVTLAQKQQDGNKIDSDVASLKNEFLRESMELMLTGTLKDEELFDVLEKRVEMQHERYRKENSTFKIIGKFPPAFGLIGATLGMIALLQGLGAPDAFEKLGPSMSVALTATFWGLFLANLIIIPIGENLTFASDDDLLMRRIVVEGVMLIKNKKHPILVEEYLKSYLAVKERKDMKKASL